MALGTLAWPGAASAQMQASLELRADDADGGSSYLMRKSTLWYNRYNPGVFTHGAAYADFNDDGLLDVLVASGTGADVRTPVKLMYGNLTSPTTYGHLDVTATKLSNAQPGLIHARKAIVGDYNGDGFPDVFVVGHGYDQPPFPGEYPQLFLSNADSTLRYDASLQSLVGFHHAAASGDIDHDGDVDILVVEQGNPFLLINAGNAVFTKNLARMPSDVLWKNFFTGEMMDVDRDGHLDMVLAGHEFEGATTTIYWGNAIGAYSALDKTVLAAMPGKGIVMDLWAEDVDGDGRRDMVVLRTGESPFYSGRAIQVLRQDAPRSFVDETGARMTMDTSQGWFDFIRVQDITGDGHLDIFIDDANSQYNGQYAWANDGSGHFAPYAGAVKPAPTLFVDDRTVIEGNAGSKTLSFSVRTSQPVIHPVAFSVATANGTAAPGVDYVEKTVANGAINFTEQLQGFQVTVLGDTRVEGHETFTVNLHGATGAIVRDGQARGVISNDDTAVLSIADAAVVEGNGGWVTLRFVVSLSAPMPVPVTYAIATSYQGGTADPAGDYTPRAIGVQTIDSGRTRQVFEVQVHGDTAVESDETFLVQLGTPANATLGDAEAVGTIVSDDVPAARAVSASTLASTLDECRVLAQRIAATEMSVAGGRRAERTGVRAILRDEKRRQQLGCASAARP
jgi:hypothetical protein